MIMLKFLALLMGPNRTRSGFVVQLLHHHPYYQKLIWLNYFSIVTYELVLVGSTLDIQLVNNQRNFDFEIGEKSQLIKNHCFVVSGCHNKFSGFRGVIESPNFPQNYENLSNCSWVISVPVGNKINITFSHFNVEASNGPCMKDYIMIQEGDNNEPTTQLLKTCDAEENVLPLRISSSERQVFVSFFSNSDVTASGFRLEWYVDGCIKHFTKPYGEFTSPGYPNGDKVPYIYVHCEWLIEVSEDKSIEITFPTIENTRSRDCLSGNYFVKLKFYNR